MNTMFILLNAEPWFLDELTGMIAAVVALSIPIVIAVLVYRHKVNETNKRTQVLLSALEKNAGAVPEEIIKGLNTPKKSLKERLLGKLQWGLLCGIAGLGIVISSTVSYFVRGRGFYDGETCVLGMVVLSVGIAFLVYYFVGRRELQKEIEAEDKGKSV